MESESAFVAPEGVYSVTEEYKPLVGHTITAVPNLYPTRLSTITVRFPAPKHNTGPGLAQLLGGGGRDKENKNKDKEKDREKLLSSGKQGDDAFSASSSETPEDTLVPGSSPDPGTDHTKPTILPNEPHKLFAATSSPQGLGKRSGKNAPRPKHNIRSTSSTFITRLQSMEGLQKVVQSKAGDVTYVFSNTGKTFAWSEVGSKKEPLTRVTFTAYPTCHDVNPFTACADRLDVIIGFSSGDLIWFDPISSRYGRLNKGGCITSSPCTAIRWVPSSPTLFLVAHADGTIIIYDKEREDAPALFSPPDPDASWNPHERMFVSFPPWHPAADAEVSHGHAHSPSNHEREREKVRNPVSHWRVAPRGRAVVDFVFSPDVKYVAAICEDGCLRVVDAVAEQLVDCYASYFGALTCVAWSPDGRFIITGGQDDLLTIFSPWEQRVVARCQGHSSFVASVAFDDVRCDGRTYRFGSVGEDNKLILWDFSSGALHRPKIQAAHHHRMSMASTTSLAFNRRASLMNLPLSPVGAGAEALKYHPAPSRNEVAVVQPVLIKHIESDLLTAVSFLPRALLTATKGGLIKLWVRPLATRGRQLKARGERIHSADIQGLIS